MAEEKLIRNPKLIIGEAEKVEAEVVGADDIVVVTDEEFYTAKEVDDLLKKSGSKLPILTHMFSDHIINDISWLRADTFSWQSGDVYVAAYEHLAEDVEVISYIVSLNSTYYRTPSDDVVINGTQYYAWTTEFGGVLLTTSATPQTSDSAYNRDGTVNIAGIQNFVTYIKGRQTDTIGDITITYYLADDGHKICLADQESNVLALYEAIGVAWYYILDTANKQFKLPRTKWGFTGLRDSVGGYVAQDVLLPNITGVVTGLGDVSVSGAFARGSKVGGNGGGGGSITADRFNASRSSSVYSGDGTNTLIQPRGTQMYLYFYVGNFEQSAVEQTAGITAETLNGKVDLPTGKAQSDVDFVVESQLPTSANGYTWYRKYKSGWVEQGGLATIPGRTNMGSSVNIISLPVTMADVNYTPMISITTGSSYWASAQVSAREPSTTTIKLIAYWNASGTFDALPVAWMVSGMSAQ